MGTSCPPAVFPGLRTKLSRTYDPTPEVSCAPRLAVAVERCTVDFQGSHTPPSAWGKGLGSA